MPNNYKIIGKDWKKKTLEFEFVAENDLEATTTISLNGGAGGITADAMTLFCEKCNKITLHDYEEGIMPFRQWFILFSTFIIGLIVIVCLDRIAPNLNGKFWLVVIFGGSFVISICLFAPFLMPLCYWSTKWTCQQCGKKWNRKFWIQKIDQEQQKLYENNSNDEKIDLTCNADSSLGK